MSPRVILFVGAVALLLIAGLVLWAGEAPPPPPPADALAPPAVMTAPAPSRAPVAVPSPIAAAPPASAPPAAPPPAQSPERVSRGSPMAPMAPVSDGVHDDVEVEAANVSAATRALEEAVRNSQTK
ncbi:MAG: hypothetical protein JNJ54_35765 [Myxococcaceae bacterium]|nr:hypothetical protein [Myxococcaceae bacterium]